MQCRPAFLRRFFLYGKAHSGVGCRHVAQTFHQGFEIQHAATDQEGKFPTGANVLHQGLCIARKFCGAVGVQGIAYVDQVMRHGSALSGAGFGAADVHAAVNQSRINADDFNTFMAKPLGCHGQGDAGFTAGRGAGQSQRQWRCKWG